MKNKFISIIIFSLMVGIGLWVMLTVFPAQSRPPLGVTNFDSIHLRDSGPTSQPVLRVDQRGAGKVVEFMDGGTPVFSINDGGGIAQTGLETLSGGLSVAPNIVVVAPTAIATATPAAYINNAGAHNSLVIAKNATPNFTVGNAGAVTGQVLQYATAGQRQFCATNTITDTVSYTSTVTAVTTPVFTLCSMNAVTGDAATCAASHATGSVTVIVRNSNATPAANAVGAAVTWCVVGTP